MQRHRLTYNPSTSNCAQRLGEPWIDQRTSNNIRFTFSAKERDEETGYNYFGARYYNADISIWLSVDPMASERAWLTPYNYVQNNPLKLTDPSGMLDICENCPKDSKFDRFRNDWRVWNYNEGIGTVSLDREKTMPFFVGISQNTPNGLLPSSSLNLGSSQNTNSGGEWTSAGKGATFSVGLATTMWEEGFKSSANYNPKYAQRGVTKTSLAAEAAQYSKYARYAWRAGNIVTGTDMLVSGAIYNYSDGSWGDLTKLGLNIGIAGLGRIRHPVALGFSIGLGIVETAGAFDGLYNSADLLEHSGILIIPSGVTPVPIFLNFQR